MCKTNCCSEGKYMCTLAWISKILLIVGGLNWGLVGLGMLMGKMDSLNLVNMIFGSMPMVEAVVYVLVGLVAVMACFGGCKCSTCHSGTCSTCSTEEHTNAKV